MSDNYEFNYDPSAFIAETEQFDEQSAANNDDLYKSELYGLVDGESVVCALIPSPNEPFGFYTHQAKPLPGSTYGEKILCLGTGTNPGLCPLCNAALSGKKGPIGRAQRYGAVSLFSFRMMAKVPREGGVSTEPVRKGAGTGKSTRLLKVKGKDKPAIVEDKWAEGTTFEYEGVKAWKGNASPEMANIHSLVTLMVKTRSQCACQKVSGEGTEAAPAEVIVTGHVCAGCGTSFHASSANKVTKCGVCGHTAVPKEVLGCTAGCDAPARRSIYNHYIKITRIGADQHTKYTFEVLPGTLKPEHRALMFETNAQGVRVPKSLDLAKLYKASKPKAEQALVSRGYNARGVPVGSVGGGGGSSGGTSASNMFDSGNTIGASSVVDDDIPF